MEKFLDKVIKHGLYLLVFLFPLWFLPWTISPLAANKQILLAVFSFLLICFWALKVIISGKLNIAWGKLSWAVVFFALVLIASTVFSAAKVQSFWGMNFESDTLFSFFLYIIVFFLFANLINTHQLKSILNIVLASAGVLSLLFLIQIFLPIFPWDFSWTAGFNSVGSAQALSVFLGGAFVILMALVAGNQAEDKNKKKIEAGSSKLDLSSVSRILSILLGIFLFISILLVNFWVVWLGIVLSLAIIIFGKLKNVIANQPAAIKNNKIVSQNNFLKPLFLPLFIFVLALLFLFIGNPFSGFVNLPIEISPTHQATFGIAWQTLEQGFKNIILGSGPATFNYQYGLYRGSGPNLTDFWHIRFDQGSSIFLTLLTTSGVLGILSLLSIMAIFLWQGFRGLIGKIEQSQKPAANIAVFVCGFYFLILWFFYSSVFSLFFISFLMLGLWQNINASERRELKEISFNQSPQKTFFIMLACIILIIFSILGIFNVSNKYIAAVNYGQGIALVNVEIPNLDKGIAKINQAIFIDAKDIYLRNFSQLFLFKVDEVLSSQELDPEQGQELLQQLISNIENSISAAIQINPKNSQNWFQAGNVYENLSLLNVEGAGDLAILNYKEAEKLDPQNPQIPFSIARVYFSLGQKEQARIELEKSLRLKPNFEPALELMELIDNDLAENEPVLFETGE